MINAVSGHFQPPEFASNIREKATSKGRVCFAFNLNLRWCGPGFVTSDQAMRHGYEAVTIVTIRTGLTWRRADSDTFRVVRR
jgi:hypothetical protein